MKVIVGIDNGISGALVALSGGGKIIWKSVMPVIKPPREGKAKCRQEVCVHALRAFLTRNKDCDPVVYMERPVGSQNAAAAISMAGCFHAVRATVQCMGIRFVRVTPMSWQKELLITEGAGDTKRAALRTATRLWPKESWQKTARCKIQFDGYIDAALIAEFGRRREVGNLGDLHALQKI